eukprot:g6643.t4
MHFLSTPAQLAGIGKYVIPVTHSGCVVAYRLMMVSRVLFDGAIVLFLLAKTHVTINVMVGATAETACWGSCVQKFSLFWAWVYLPATAVLCAVALPAATNHEDGGCHGGIESFRGDDSTLVFFAAFTAGKVALTIKDHRDINASIVQYHLATDLNKDLSNAWLNLGIALSAMGRDDEAMSAYKVLVKLPTALPFEVAIAYCNHGNLARSHAGVDFALLEEAVLLFKRGLEILPESPKCLYNFGLATEELRRNSEATDLYSRALRLDPSLGDAHVQIGNIAFQSGNWTEAIRRYERAYASPDADRRLRTVSSFLLGQLHLHGMGDHRSAVGYYKRSFDIDNTFTNSLCGIFNSIRSLCLWEDWESLEPRVASAILDRVSSGQGSGPQSPYETLFTGELRASQHLGLARLASQKYDRVNSRVFAVAASYGPDDASSVRRSVERCSGTFLDLLWLERVETAKLVAAERPQIFVDLVSHTFGARPGVLALKPAPIVAAYLGYPGTAGAKYTDYAIVDQVVVPPELANVGFSEKVVYLPHSYQANDYNVSQGFCPGGEGLSDCHALVRSSRGLTGFLDSWGTEGPVLCNFNAIRKMEPESFGVFMNIIKRWVDSMMLPEWQPTVVGSVLVLLGSSGDHPRDAELSLRAEAASRGIHPDRIWFEENLSRDEHILRESGSCDLFVDSLVYGAHTTAADALWAGLPLLTLRGYGVDDTPVGQMRGRVGTSLVSALGLPELSFHGVKELEDAAVALLQSPGRLASLRKRLLSSAMSTPVFDTQLVTRSLERAFEAMWETRELGLPPSHIVVDPTRGPLPHPSRETDNQKERAGADPFRVSFGSARHAEKDFSQAGATINDMMGARALEEALAWAGTRTTDGAEAAYVATGRVLAGSPLSVEALDLRGVALHLLRRNAEATDVMERAALLGTSIKHTQPGVNLAYLWGNLAAAQQAAAEDNGLPFAPAATTTSFLQALALSPSEPSPLHHLLISHLRRGNHTACADAFWKHWVRIRGYAPPAGRREAAEAIEKLQTDAAREMEGASPEGYGDGWAWGMWHGRGASSVAGVAETAATCFAKLGRFEEAWRALKLASDIQPDNQEFPLRYAAALEGAGHEKTAHQEFNRIIKALNHVWFYTDGGSAVPKIPRPRAEAHGQASPTVVALYCYEYGNAWFPNWGPSDLDLGRGLGGSEEVVIHLSRELANLGFWVEVYADPKEIDVGRDYGYGRDGGGVVWYPYKAYDISYPPDVFISWRYHVSLHLADGSRGRRFLWLHDLLPPFFSGIVDILDGIVCPSRYHASHIEPHNVRSVIHVVPNGIDPRGFQDGTNSPDIFVFGSAPNRGLRAVLLMWPYIRSQIRTATLEVYYGFSANFLKWGEENITGFIEWMGEMKRLLGQEGVLYKGMVDHDTLHAAYARAGFVLYPSAFPETGCISLIKAMAMGAIPITSRYPTSTLPELTSEWDMGPLQALASHNAMAEQDIAWLESWAKAVVHASTTDRSERNAQRDAAIYVGDGDVARDGVYFEGGDHHEGIQARRRAMKAAVRKRYAFSTMASLWAEEMRQ